MISQMLFKKWVLENNVNKVFEVVNEMLKENNLTEEQRQAILKTMDDFTEFLKAISNDE